MATKCVNDTTGPEGLCPTLLVYGTIPRPARRTPAATQIQRADAIRKGMEEVRKVIAKRKISFALKHPCSKEAQEQERRLRLLPAGSPVRVFRTKSKKWEGPFPFISIDDGVAVIQMPRGRKLFRSSAVKPVSAYNPAMPEFIAQQDTTEDTENQLSSGTNDASSVRHTSARFQITSSASDLDRIPRGKSRRSDVHLQHATPPSTSAEDALHAKQDVDENADPLTCFCFYHDSSHSPVLECSWQIPDDDTTNHHQIFLTSAMSSTERDFEESRTKEIRGLLKRGTFQIVHRDSVPNGERIYGTKWVDVIKQVDGKSVPKSRLVAQNYCDEGALEISTRSPTISRTGQRLVLATAAQNADHVLYSRDIIQAYLQSQSELERSIFLKPPMELNLDDDFVLRAVKPLYGIPESGLHWFLTYQDHHLNRLGMQPTRYDPCLLFLRDNNRTLGITALQVDDNLVHGSSAFLELEEANSKVFDSKPRVLLTLGKSAVFNGVRIATVSPTEYTIDQRDKLMSITEPTNEDDLVSTRAKLQYVGSCCRPDLCAPVQLLAAEVANPNEDRTSK